MYGGSRARVRAASAPIVRSSDFRSYPDDSFLQDGGSGAEKFDLQTVRKLTYHCNLNILVTVHYYRLR